MVLVEDFYVTIANGAVGKILGPVFDVGDWTAMSVQFDVIEYSGTGTASVKIESSISDRDFEKWSDAGSSVSLSNQPNQSYVLDISSGLRMFAHVAAANSSGNSATYLLRITVFFKKRGS